MGALFTIKLTSWILDIYNVTKGLKKGDLTHRLEYDYKDQLYETSKALNESQDNMVTLITDIDNVANKLQNSTETFKENYIKMNTSIEKVNLSSKEVESLSDDFDNLLDNINKFTFR